MILLQLVKLWSSFERTCFCVNSAMHEQVMINSVIHNVESVTR
jgi:hypothetical protein